jgi:hypothetical protein
MHDEDVIEAPPPLPAPPAANFPAWPARQLRPPPIEHRFVFDGRAGEYFRIWIVNLALSILTLGIFSAWAKVRTQRYFYGNTRLAGVPFEYLAKPLPILKGRIIAVVLFSGYVLAGQVSIGLQLGLALLIAVLTPWLVVRGAAFRTLLARRDSPPLRARHGGPISASSAFHRSSPWPVVSVDQAQKELSSSIIATATVSFPDPPGQFYPPDRSPGVIMALMLVAALMVVVVHASPRRWRRSHRGGDVIMVVIPGYFVVLASLPRSPI